MKTPVVITSIQAPTAAVDAIIRQGHHLLVIGDRRSPDAEAYARENLTYISLKHQRSVGGALAAILPENSYSRKNIGYLLMAADGSGEFIETDDDNSPRPDWQASLATRPSLVRRPETRAGCAAVNVYALFGQEDVWPRGFPLTHVRSPVPSCVDEVLDSTPWVVQGLADGEPDVDAIFRLVFPGRSISFADGLPVRLDKGQWCPFNSQNTLWRSPAYPLAYLPFTVSMRFTDILRGYIAQVCLQAAGEFLVFTGASVWQDRNPHDPLEDFANEVDCYLKGGEVMERLFRLPLVGNPGKDLVACYQELVAAGIVERAELSGVTAWLEDLAKFSG